MALDPLATTEDLPEGTTGNTARALLVASAAIRDAAGVPISSITATVEVEAVSTNLLRLPGPITAVDSVTIDGTEITDYEKLPNGLWRHCGWHLNPVPVVVTYTFGLVEVPDDIIDLTCQLALAWLQHQAAGGGSTAGLKSVKIDDASESYTDESAGQVSPVFIPEATRTWLAQRFGGGTEVVLSL
ncbi:MAG TPA: hypothetical protein VFK41_03055 [Nocardioidaceae bacterium]|nr:hypothetical protein [Nocardioidaceae bacterium]